MGAFMPLDNKFTQRLIMLLYGRTKVGKTTLCLQLAEAGHYVYFISTDRGLLQANLNSERYKGHVMVAYPERGNVSYMNDIRKTCLDTKERVIALSKKVPAAAAGKNIWVVVDTLTHLQAELMTEARKVDISHPNAKAPRDEMVRDHTTQIDYGLNLTFMVEVSQMLTETPCNIIYTALENQSDKDGRGRTVYRPQLTGQSLPKFMGDADIVARLTLDDSDTRILQCRPIVGVEAGDRSGRLDAVEVPDLGKLRDKIFASVPVAA